MVINNLTVSSYYCCYDVKINLETFFVNSIDHFKNEVILFHVDLIIKLYNIYFT